VKFAAGPPEGPSLAELAAGRSTADLVASRTDEAQRHAPCVLTASTRAVRPEVRH
jgi:hypothetical protein